LSLFAYFITMHTSLRHVKAASKLLAAVTRLQQLLPCAHYSPTGTAHWRLAVTQAGHVRAQHHAASGLLPWHVLCTQPKSQQQTGGSKQQQEQTQQSSNAAGQQATEQQGTKQEQQQEQEQQHQQEQQGSPDQEQDSPLEGPNGLLAEWRVESSRWWSNMFYLVVGKHSSALSASNTRHCTCALACACTTQPLLAQHSSRQLA
jgi:hypothetical protein